MMEPMSTATLTPTATGTETVLLVKVSAKDNNNKFYEVSLDENTGRVSKRWGRVGSNGQTGSEMTGRRGFDRVLREKHRKKYVVVQSDGSGIAGASATPADLAVSARLGIVPNQKDDKLLALVSSWCDANRHRIESASNGRITVAASGAVQTALGHPVSPATVQKARLLLTQIDTAPQLPLSALEEYLMLIPQDVGRTRGWESQFEDPSKIAEQFTFLDDLEGAAAITATTKDTPDDEDDTDTGVKFRYQLATIAERTKKFKEIRDAYHKTRKGVHSASRLDLVGLYSISEPNSQFPAVSARLGNVKQLWHGTGVSNLISVLHRGLYAPSRGGTAQITGRMFGDGVYLAPDSTKALNYSDGYWSGTRSSTCFMLYTDTALGKPYMARSSGTGGSRSGGYNSLWAKGREAGVMNDEIVVWNTDQISLTYVCQFA